MVNDFKNKVLRSEKFRVGRAVAVEIASNKNIHLLLGKLCKKCKRKAKRLIIKKTVGLTGDVDWCDYCSSEVDEFRSTLDDLKIRDVIKKELMRGDER